VECSDPGISGNTQRNCGLNLAEDGFVYFLDDDNVVHPDFWAEFPSMVPDNYYSWDQLRNPAGDDTDWVLFKNEKGKILRGDTLKLQRIDTAQVLIPKKFFEGLQWKTDDYKADGILIESVYKKNPSSHIYIPKVLSYYNHLG
jgi:glycosyltransferase involved in cell wall biosynthesis